MDEKKRVSRREALGILSTGVAASTLGCAPGIPSAVGAPGPVTDYSLQAGIQNLHVPETVTVVGVGGFGSWPALFSALSGVRNLVLVDPANLDTKDFSRTPFGPRYVGMPKVEAMRHMIAELRPGTNVETHVQYFVAGRDESLLKGTVLFDGVNDQTLTQQFPQIASSRGMRYATGFYNGTRIGVANQFLPGTRVRSGAVVPVWSVSAALAGVLAVHSVFVEPLTFVGSPEAIRMPSDRAAAMLGASEMMDK